MGQSLRLRHVGKVLNSSVASLGFQGRRIDQLQDGSRPSSWKITAESRGFPSTARLVCSRGQQAYRK